MITALKGFMKLVAPFLVVFAMAGVITLIGVIVIYSIFIPLGYLMGWNDTQDISNDSEYYRNPDAQGEACIPYGDCY